MPISTKNLPLKKLAKVSTGPNKSGRGSKNSKVVPTSKKSEKPKYRYKSPFCQITEKRIEENEKLKTTRRNRPLEWLRPSMLGKTSIQLRQR